MCLHRLFAFTVLFSSARFFAHSLPLQLSNLSNKNFTGVVYIVVYVYLQYQFKLSLFPPMQLREQMLSRMTSVLLDSPSNSPLEVYVTAKAVAGLTQISDELSPSAQVHTGVQ